jgi:hypothetical protein
MFPVIWVMMELTHVSWTEMWCLQAPNAAVAAMVEGEVTLLLKGREGDQTVSSRPLRCVPVAGLAEERSKLVSLPERARPCGERCIAENDRGGGLVGRLGEPRASCVAAKPLYCRSEASLGGEATIHRSSESAHLLTSGI